MAKALNNRGRTYVKLAKMDEAEEDASKVRHPASDAPLFTGDHIVFGSRDGPRKHTPCRLDYTLVWDWSVLVAWWLIIF